MRRPNTIHVVSLVWLTCTSIPHAQEKPASEQRAVPDTMIVGAGGDAIPVLLPRPVEWPAPKRPHYIDCRGPLLHFVPLAELKTAASEALAKARQRVGEDPQALMASLATTTVQKGAFAVDPTMLLLDQLALLPAEAPADCDARGLSATATDHCFVQYCRSLDPGKDAIHLIIRGAPAVEIEEMRNLAHACGIEIETSDVSPEGMIRFGMSE